MKEAVCEVDVSVCVCGVEAHSVEHTSSITIILISLLITHHIIYRQPHHLRVAVAVAEAAAGGGAGAHTTSSSPSPHHHHHIKSSNYSERHEIR